MLGHILYVNANTGLVHQEVCYLCNIVLICTTVQYMSKTKYALLHHPPTYTNVYIGIGSKRMYKVHFNGTAVNLIPSIAISRTSGFKSQGCGLECCCGQDLFLIFYFVLFDALLAGRLGPYKFN